MNQSTFNRRPVRFSTPRCLSRTRPPHLRDNHTGFTLVEILIALSLSTVLLTSVYASLNLYWRVSTAGQTQVEQSQLTRAIFRQMEIDLGSLVYTPPEPASDSGDQAASETGSTGSGSGSAFGNPNSSGGGFGGGQGGGQGGGRPGNGGGQ
ncbi:MAG TPA: prepilin-type N-terminal cleavage/methylation domain-containing protein, partial [Caulifigura sp.]|nr:prepilin-type N-terminal cleavage/methylation domain-containing protein [Caulifigura sp.]